MPESLDFKWSSPRRSTQMDHKIEIDMSKTYCDQVLKPLYSYMMLLGLNHTHSKAQNSRWRIPIKIYNYATLCLLILATVVRITQIKQQPKEKTAKGSFQGSVLDPTFVLSLCHALLLFSGLSAAFLLLKLQSQRERMYLILDQGLGRNRNEKHDKQQVSLNKFFVFISFFFSSSMAAVQIGTKLGFVDLPYTPDLISQNFCFILLEGYVIFLAQSSILLLAILFFQLCRVLQFSIKKLVDEMVPKEKDEFCTLLGTFMEVCFRCPLPEQSLQQIHDVQIHYQEIYNAKHLIEDNFSVSLFYTYGCCIPLTCLLGYIAFRNAQANITETISVVIWLVNTMLTLMLFSVPAFMTHEEGDKLLSASFKMYHETLCEERDLLVLSQMSFLTFQMHSTKLTLTAANFFPMNRKILISLFSTIFTYFLILVQFDAEGSRTDCNGGSRVLIIPP